MKVNMNYCMHCGTKLISKYSVSEARSLPYCEQCGDFRFPVFNTAVIMIVINRDRIILIKQYGRPDYILVAGYVNQGEDAEDAVVRELQEELDLKAVEIHFNHSHYFPPSNTLMLNFTVRVDTDLVLPNKEIDTYHWFTFDEARTNIKKNSLAQSFLEGFFTGEYHWPL